MRFLQPVKQHPLLQRGQWETLFGQPYVHDRCTRSPRGHQLRQLLSGVQRPMACKPHERSAISHRLEGNKQSAATPHKKASRDVPDETSLRVLAYRWSALSTGNTRSCREWSDLYRAYATW